MESLSDAELVANHLDTGAGTSVWLQELFRRHYSRVVLWCLRIAGDREEAHDLAQGVFVKAQRHLASFRGDSTVSTWLYSITRSECINFLRASAARATVAGEAAPDEPSDPAAAPDQLLDRERSLRLAREILEQELNETEKLVFTLHCGDDMPLDTITRLLGLANRSGAKAFIVSARRKLARAIARWKAAQERMNA